MIPQIIYLTIFGVILLTKLFSKSKFEKYNIFENIIVTILLCLLYYFGGFWTAIKIPTQLKVPMFQQTF